MGLKISKNAPFWAILGQLTWLKSGKPLELRIQKKFSRLLVHGEITIGKVRTKLHSNILTILILMIEIRNAPYDIQIC